MDVFDLAAKISLDTSPFEKGLDSAKGKMSAFGDVFKANIASDMVSKGFSAIVNGTKAAVGGIKNLVDQSQAAYGDYQQMVGGVQKLYGNMGQTWKEYSKTTGDSSAKAKAHYKELEEAQNLVMKNADTAYRTAGMSANQYMETATQFSASLIKSLGGDTKKAAEQTDVAMRAISDNFNTFGGNIEDVINAYKGFSKQNYTMLDNLKLGYGGTKTEMQNLIKDANTYAKSIGQAGDLSIDSFSDIVQAIELIQEKQQIAGTTAREASTTLQGSMLQMQSAWENLKTAIADPDADLGKKVDQLVETITGRAATAEDVAVGAAKKAGDHINGYLDNLLPVISKAIDGIANLISNAAPIIAEQIPNILEKLVPPVLKAIASLASTIIENLPKIVESIEDALSESFASMADPSKLASKASSLIAGLADAVAQVIPDIINIGTDIITAILQGLTENAPLLLDGAAKIVAAVGSGIIKNLPLMVDAAVNLIQALTKYIADNKEQINSGIKALVSAIVQGIAKLAPELAEAALTIVSTLGSALIDSIPEIVKQLPTFVGGLFKALGDAFKNADAGGKATIIAALTPTLVGGVKGAIEAVQKSKDIIGKGTGIAKGIAGKLFRKKSGAGEGLDDLYDQMLADEEMANGVGSAAGAEKVSSAASGAGKISESVAGLKNKLAKIPSPKDVLKGLADLAIIIGGLTALVTAIGAFMQIPGVAEANSTGISTLQATFGGIASIGVPLAAMSAAIVGMGALVSPTVVLKGLGDMAIIIGGLEGLITAIGGFLSLGSLSQFLSGGTIAMVQTFTALDEIMKPLAEFSGLLVGLGIASPGVILSGLAGFSEVVVGLEGVLTVLGGLSQIPGFDWIVNEGGEALKKLASVLGEAVGALAGGALEGISDSFPQVGSKLSEFMTNATPFFNGIGMVNADTLAATKNLGDMILSLTKADILQGLTSWLTGGSSIVTFGKQIAEFGPYLSKYASSIKGVDSSAVESTANAAKALAQMAKAIPNSGGLASLFAGENSITKFGKELPKFGRYMSQYADTIKGVDSDAVTSSANAGKALAQMAKAIPNSGGIGSLFSGDNGIAKWGKELVKFGKQFRQYSDQIKGIDTAKVSATAKALKEMVTSAKAIPTTGNGGISDSLSKYFDGMDRKLKEMQDKVSRTLDSMKTTLKESATRVGQFVVDGIWQGIQNKQGELYSKVRRFAKGIATAAQDALDINSPSKVMRDEVGAYIAQGVAVGIEKDEKKATNAARRLAQKVVKTAKGEVLKSNKQSDSLAESVISAYEKEQSAKNSKSGKSTKSSKSDTKKTTKKTTADDYDDAIIKAATQRAKKLKDANKMSEKEEARFWVSMAKKTKGSNGYATAMVKATTAIAKSQKDRYDKADKNLQNYQSLHTTSAKFEATYWKTLRDTFKRGSTEYTKANKNYHDSLKNIDAENLQTYQDYINNYSAYHKGVEMSAKRQASYWKKILDTKEFKKGSKEWLEVQKAYYQASSQAQQDYLSKLQKHVSDYATLHKGVAMTAKQERDYWKSVLDDPDFKKSFKKGSDGWLQVEGAYLDAQKKITDGVKSAYKTFQSSAKDAKKTLESSLQSIADSITSKGESLRQSLGDFYKVFSAGDPVDEASLWKALDSQENAATEGKKLMDRIGSVIGKDSKFYKTLEEMGYENGIAYWRVFAGMSDDKLKEYADRQDKLLDSQKETAKDFMEPEINKQLNDAVTAYTKSMTDATKAMNKELKTLGVTWDDVSTKIRDGFDKLGGTDFNKVLTKVRKGITDFTAGTKKQNVTSLMDLIMPSPEKVEESKKTLTDSITSVVQAVLPTEDNKTATDAVATTKDYVSTAVQSIADTVAGKTQESTQSLVSKVESILQSGLGALAGKASVWGADMLQGFVDGARSKLAELQQVMAEIASVVSNNIGFSEPKEGPLSNFHTYAPDMMDLFSQGIRDNGYKIADAFDETLGMNQPKDYGAFTVQADPNAITNATGVNQILSTLQEYLPQLGNQQIMLDGRTLVGATANRMNEELAYVNNRRAGAFA